MKPSHTPPCPPVYQMSTGAGSQSPVVAVPAAKEQESSPANVRLVIEALCEGLNLANSVGDANKAELFNEALSSFTSLSYERGKFTRENELLRADVEWLRNEVHLMMKDRLAK